MALFPIKFLEVVGHGKFYTFPIHAKILRASASIYLGGYVVARDHPGYVAWTNLDPHSEETRKWVPVEHSNDGSKTGNLCYTAVLPHSIEVAQPWRCHCGELFWPLEGHLDYLCFDCRMKYFHMEMAPICARLRELFDARS